MKREKRERRKREEEEKGKEGHCALGISASALGLGESLQAEAV